MPSWCLFTTPCALVYLVSQRIVHVQDAIIIIMMNVCVVCSTHFDNLQLKYQANYSSICEIL